MLVYSCNKKSSVICKKSTLHIVQLQTNLGAVCYRPEDAAATGLWDGHELLLLLGLPWNVEVIVSRDSAPAARSQLRLDTFVDALPREEAQGSRTVGSGPHGAKTMVSDVICKYT